MQLKIKKEIKEGMVRLENMSVIREVLIKQDLGSPEKDAIMVCFSNENSSGIVEFSRKEFDGLVNSVKASRLGKVKKI